MLRKSRRRLFAPFQIVESPMKAKNSGVARPAASDGRGMVTGVRALSRHHVNDHALGIGEMRLVNECALQLTQERKLQAGWAGLS